MGWEKTLRWEEREGRWEKPLERVKALRSRTCSPMRIAGRFSTWEFFEVIIPKGRLERENSLSEGMDSQDLRVAIV